MDPAALIHTAFSLVRSASIDAVPPADLHRRRSIKWVEALAHLFRDHFAADLTVRVFSKYTDTNRDDFGLNELLYDICVCRFAKTLSCTGRKELCYITDCLWQIESEFARDSAAAVKDFNKLVLG